MHVLLNLYMVHMLLFVIKTLLWILAFQMFLMLVHDPIFLRQYKLKSRSYSSSLILKFDNYKSNAKKGGESKFVSVYKIHNERFQLHKNDFILLYEKFHYDKRGEFVDGESPTVHEPIFKVEDNFLKCRYLRKLY